MAGTLSNILVSTIARAQYRLIERISEFLDEDIGYGDITIETFILKSQRAIGKLQFKEPGSISGRARSYFSNKKKSMN